MKRMLKTLLVALLALMMIAPCIANAGTYCIESGYSQSARATQKLALRADPTTKSKDLGTYYVEGRYITLTGRAWDNANGIWWVRCEFNSEGRTVVGWTGKKRFSGTIPDFYGLPEYEIGTTSSSGGYSGGYVSYSCESALAIDKLALRAQPTTKSEYVGTFNQKGNWITLSGRHWDSVNEIWWVRCEFYSNGRQIIGWTGTKRFSSSSYDLYNLPQY